MSYAPSTSVPLNPTGLRSLVQVIVRRRIAISLITFSALIAYNLIVRGTRPANLFDVAEAASLVGLSLIVIGLAIRSWAAGTLVKHDQLTVQGIYGLVRNPLYVGSFLMMFGFCTAMYDWLSMAFVAVPMVSLYWFQVRMEENRMAQRFPLEWANYAATTPRVLPSKVFEVPFQRWFDCWSGTQWMRNREYQAVGATVLGLLLLAIYRAVGFPG